MSDHRGATFFETMGIVIALVSVYAHEDRLDDLARSQRDLGAEVRALRTRLAAAELAAIQSMDQANLAYADAGAAHQRLEYLREQVVFAFQSIDSRRTRLPRPYPDPPRPTAIMAPACYATDPEDPDVAP